MRPYERGDAILQTSDAILKIVQLLCGVCP